MSLRWTYDEIKHFDGGCTNLERAAELHGGVEHWNGNPKTLLQGYRIGVCVEDLMGCLRTKSEGELLPYLSRWAKECAERAGIVLNGSIVTVYDCFSVASKARAVSGEGAAIRGKDRREARRLEYEWQTTRLFEICDEPL